MRSLHRFERRNSKVKRSYTFQILLNFYLELCSENDINVTTKCVTFTSLRSDQY